MKVRSSQVLVLGALFIPWFGCVHSSAPTDEPNQNLQVSVAVDTEEVLRVVPPFAYGMHASVYDNAIQDPDLGDQLDEAGIALLRWPGGGYSDNYHWADHNPDAESDPEEVVEIIRRRAMCPWAPRQRGADYLEEPDNIEGIEEVEREIQSRSGYLAQGSDFGGFIEMLDRVGRAAMITVNYGSNAECTGPGEPKEAAAWVAYANGHPDDETRIGEDSTGYDWETVGYWATMRASGPLAEDDGFNFLRIEREEPVGIEYWEVGNEVFGNGYYVNNEANYTTNDQEVGFELDLHLPYDGAERFRNELLSPTTYGQGVRDFAEAMKAVDPSIKVGVVLVTPPDDYTWALEWNGDVLTECGEVVDFGIIHWYPQGDLLTRPAQDMDEMFEVLQEEIDEHVSDPNSFEITVTEVGPPPGYDDKQASVMGLFAADIYLSFVRHGATNVDWLELHNGTFLDERSPLPGRAYYGVQFAHDLAGPGESLVAAEASRFEIRAHAGVRDDGSVAVLLINTDVYRTVEASVDVPGVGSVATVRSFRSSDSRTPDSVTEAEPIDVEDGSFSIVLEAETLALIEFEVD